MMRTPAQDSASLKKKLGLWGTLLTYFLAAVCRRNMRLTCLRNTSDVPMKVVTRRYYQADFRSGFLEKKLTFEIPPHQVVLVHHAAYKRSPDLHANGTPDAKVIRATFDSYDLMMNKEIQLAYEHEDGKVGFQSNERKLPKHIRIYRLK